MSLIGDSDDLDRGVLISFARVYRGSKSLPSLEEYSEQV